MLLADMLIETPVRESDILDRPSKPGHEGENQCSYCGVGVDDPWYDSRDIMVIRHWTSRDVGDGGHWTWYCPRHFDNRDGNWWRSSHEAPEHLKPPVTHRCQAQGDFRSERCGHEAVEPFDGVWMCERHAASERLRLRVVSVLRDVDPVERA
jgi:hypothetical protein